MELLPLHTHTHTLTLQLVLFGEEHKSRGAAYSVFSAFLLLFLRPVLETLLQGNLKFSKNSEETSV